MARVSDGRRCEPAAWVRALDGSIVQIVAGTNQRRRNMMSSAPLSNVSVFLRARAYRLRRSGEQAAVLRGREAERAFEGVAEVRLM